MNDLKLGFIGCGNMGGAIIRAVSKSSLNPLILINDHHPEKTGVLAEETGAVVSDKETVAGTADFIFLGVKPQMLENAIGEIKDILLKRKSRFIIVSMAAATTVETLSSFFGARYPAIRIMPNLPVAVCEGITAYYPEGISEEELETFKAFMSESGMLIAVPEDKLDVCSGISGCGPAFAAMFIEALADGGVSLGLKRKDSYLLAEQMLKGTAKLLLETGMHPGTLKDNVSSPGGTTIAGVLTLERNGFRGAVSDAVRKTYERVKEL